MAPEINQDLSVDEDIVDLRKNIKESKKKKLVKNEIPGDPSEKKLAAGWRIVNERLQDLKALEQRNKSQIKYEVDKAFEMSKYLDETNFTARDPATSKAYTNMVQMCLSKLD